MHLLRSLRAAVLSSFFLFVAIVCQGEDSPYPPTLELPGIEFAADPCVISYQGVYYLYPTASSVDIECWSSEDLETWEYRGVVWEQKPAGSWNDAGVWAPHVFEEGGVFYLYYTANTRIGLAVADSPTGPFTEVFDQPFIGGGQGGVALGAIDAFVFRDVDGQLYLYYVGYEPLSTIRVVRMVDPFTLTDEHFSLLTADIFSWKRFICEAPWVFRNGDRYYLMFSGNGANRPGYALGYAVADTPTGYFLEYEDNPILNQEPRWDFYGPGHNSVVTGPEGDLITFYHTKVSAEKSFNRKIRKSPLIIDAEGNLVVLLNQAEDEEPVDDNEQDQDNENSDPGCG